MASKRDGIVRNRNGKGSMEKTSDHTGLHTDPHAEPQTVKYKYRPTPAVHAIQSLTARLSNVPTG